MVQNPKGGGLSSSFGGGGTQQLGGVKKTGDFLDKSTWFLAIALIILILASNLTIDSGNAIESKALDLDEAIDMPMTPPATTDDSATTDGAESGS
tara:strand:- start:12624 stop:12908 length:285 start_codon:yes stop_codon:yes gene_type:complete